jgi:hypothetical protein
MINSLHLNFVDMLTSIQKVSKTIEHHSLAHLSRQLHPAEWLFVLEHCLLTLLRSLRFSSQLLLSVGLLLL